MPTCRICFNQLNVGTGNRVAQQLVDSKTGETVDRDRIVKGYEFERGSYVTILARIEKESRGSGDPD